MKVQDRAASQQPNLTQRATANALLRQLDWDVTTQNVILDAQIHTIAAATPKNAPNQGLIQSARANVTET